jgi:hypothetical protein
VWSLPFRLSNQNFVRISNQFHAEDISVYMEGRRAPEVSEIESQPSSLEPITLPSYHDYYTLKTRSLRGGYVVNWAPRTQDSFVVVFFPLFIPSLTHVPFNNQYKFKTRSCSENTLSRSAVPKRRVAKLKKKIKLILIMIKN